MVNKAIKLFGITLLGTIAFACSPFVSYAQYSQVYTNGGMYTYVNNYSQLSIGTTTATNITATSAALNGLVNGSNLYNTYNLTTWFEYGTTPSLGYSTLRNNSNSGYANFSANVAGLNPGTAYYFRAVGQNPQGVVYGATNVFRTEYAATVNTNTGEDTNGGPAVITNPPTSVSARNAKLNALIINSIDSPFNTYFEWGTTESLGMRTPVLSLGALPKARHINTIAGLLPRTTYYFRAVVENPSTRINGAILNFTTGGVASAAAPVEKITDRKDTATAPDADTEATEPAGGTLLPASALLSGAFFPGNILGWLMLITLLLLLILISKHFYRNLAGNKMMEQPEGHRHA